MRTIGGHWPDRELAVTMNRMRCKSLAVAAPSPVDDEHDLIARHY